MFVDTYLFIKNPELHTVYLPGYGIVREGDLCSGEEFDKYSKTKPPLLVKFEIPQVEFVEPKVPQKPKRRGRRRSK